MDVGLIASRKTLVPSGISGSGFPPSAVKQLILFCKQLADLPGWQGKNAPTLCYCSLRPGGSDQV
jgi:hypothetical protein